jgi:hypothetical protein
MAEHGFTHQIEYESRGEERSSAVVEWTRRLDEQLARFGYMAELIAEGTHQDSFDRGVSGLLVHGHKHCMTLCFVAATSDC